MKNLLLFLVLTVSTISIKAQDIQISFAGTGASSTVDSVKVENLTQGTSAKIKGTDIFYLSGSITGIAPLPDASNSYLRISPNPMTESSIIDFKAVSSGPATIDLFDLSGKKVAASTNTLTAGNHSYKVSGLHSGIYLLKINAQGYSYAGKLLSNGTTGTGIRITYQGSNADPSPKLKSREAATTMPYNAGDQILFTGISGIYSTIVASKPTQNSIITFNFIPCTDADGNNYRVVQIGNQVWMAENLYVTHYRDGSSIPNLTENSAWDYPTKTDTYCWLNNDSAMKTKYGALYNWFAVSNPKDLSPVGWHVPTNSELTTLSEYLGGNTVAGGKLKESGFAHWKTPNTVATNETGFNALPGGERSFFSFPDTGEKGYWWTNTANGSYGAIFLMLSNSEGKFSRVIQQQSFGLSVRCVKDDASSTTVPTLHTAQADSITSASANCGGNITDDGRAAITARGVCWNTVINPTINDSHTSDGAGTGIFKSTLTGLKPNTKYYVRAYATNSAGTAYGIENMLFATLLPKGTEGTVTDVEGNVYKTITIGTQTWMAENLKTTRYKNGSPIPNQTDNSAWQHLSTPAFAWLNNDSATYHNMYGVLYNGFAVGTGKLAPKGWHVPTDDEWGTLVTYLGGISVAGGKLKESGTAHWLSPNTGANNEVGFTALPGSVHEGAGMPGFGLIGRSACWWSSTQNGNNNNSAGYIYVSSDYESIYISKLIKTMGFSVRCIKDESSGDVATKLTGGASKTWVVDPSIPAHFGVGPWDNSSVTPDWWTAQVNEKLSCCPCFYTSKFTFTKIADGNYTLTVATPDGAYTKTGLLAGGLPGIPASGDEACYNYAGGISAFSLIPASSGIPSTNTSILLSGVNTFIGYGATSKEYEILKITDSTLYLRVQGTETGNAWYLKLKKFETPIVKLSNPSTYPITQPVSFQPGCGGYVICDFTCSIENWDETLGAPKFQDANGNIKIVNGALLQNITNNWEFGHTSCTNSGADAVIFYDISINNDIVKGKVKVIGDFSGYCSEEIHPYSEMYFTSFDFALISSTLSGYLKTDYNNTYQRVSNFLSTHQ